MDECSLSAVDQSQNLLGTTFKNIGNFSLCLRFIDLLVFDLLCSQNLDILYFFKLSIFFLTLLNGIG